jgi:hypothetical protein
MSVGGGAASSGMPASARGMGPSGKPPDEDEETLLMKPPFPPKPLELVDVAPPSPAAPPAPPEALGVGFGFEGALHTAMPVASAKRPNDLRMAACMQVTMHGPARRNKRRRHLVCPQIVPSVLTRSAAEASCSTDAPHVLLPACDSIDPRRSGAPLPMPAAQPPSDQA